MPIPYDIDWGMRNAVLTQLAADVVAAGGTVVGLDKNAGETHPNWVTWLNRISAAMNTLGASPPLPIYSSLDRNAFGSVVNNIVTAVMRSPPVNLTAPVCSVVTGGNVAGTSVLTCSTGSWSGEPSYTRQWLHNGSAIAGATAASYQSQASDSGASISCTITATNTAGNNSVTSNAIALT